MDEAIPPETPYLYGLHPNAEIEFLTTTSENLFRTVLEMQPRDAGSGAAGGSSREEKVWTNDSNWTAAATVVYSGCTSISVFVVEILYA